MPEFDAFEVKETKGQKQLELSDTMESKFQEMMDEEGKVGEKAQETYDALKQNLAVLNKLTSQSIASGLLPDKLTSDEASAVLAKVERDLEDVGQYLGTWLEGNLANDESFLQAVKDKLNEPLVDMLTDKAKVKKWIEAADDQDVNNVAELECAIAIADAEREVRFAETGEEKQAAEAKLAQAKKYFTEAERITRRDEAYALADKIANL